VRESDAILQARLHEKNRLVGTTFQRASHAERLQRGDWQPEVRDHPDVERAIVAGWPDSDDRDGDTIDADGATDYGRIRAEPAPPDAMAQDGHDRCAARLLVR
jgi:hypothetical protein